MQNRTPGWRTLLMLTMLLSVGCGNVTSLPNKQDASGATGAGGTAGAGGAGGAVDSGGAAGTGGAVGSGGTVGSGGAGGTTDRDGGASCNCGAFAGFRACCGDRCINLENDPANCGACGNRCTADKPFCENGTCGSPPCNSMTCGGAANCCGGACCQPGQICCSVSGPISSVISCHTPTADLPTCPPGCAPLCMSDRNSKRAIAPVDPKLILTKVTQLPIATWQYLSDPESVRHMGPMAQDFKAAFGLGDTDRAYHPVDAHGVALASIQALAQLAEEQKRRIDLLQRENDALEHRLQILESHQRRKERRNNR